MDRDGITATVIILIGLGAFYYFVRIPDADRLFSGNEVVTDEYIVACRLNGVYKILSERTSNAKTYEKFLSQAQAHGQCRQFEAGTRFVVEEKDYEAGTIRVRVRGEVDSYWTAGQRLSDAAQSS